mmetsp:Transcript_21361/g.29881  ORF Transcript_21361/g.29881 Transcript_21361/m.29881 type:complete len:90 (-) Transcript_21361:111-380(-)
MFPLELNPAWYFIQASFQNFDIASPPSQIRMCLSQRCNLEGFKIDELTKTKVKLKVVLEHFDIETCLQLSPSTNRGTQARTQKNCTSTK